MSLSSQMSRGLGMVSWLVRIRVGVATAMAMGEWLVEVEISGPCKARVKVWGLCHKGWGSSGYKAKLCSGSDPASQSQCQTSQSQSQSQDKPTSDQHKRGRFPAPN